MRFFSLLFACIGLSNSLDPDQTRRSVRPDLDQTVCRGYQQTIAWVQSSIFSNAYILKSKRIKIYHIKGIGCPLLMSFLTKERKNKKEEKMVRLEPRLANDEIRH